MLVPGASGKTGTEVVRQGPAAGHKVTALVPSPARLTASDPRLLVKTAGDARNAADLRRALEGQEAVISTLGSNKTSDALIGRVAGGAAAGGGGVLLTANALVAPEVETASSVDSGVWDRGQKVVPAKGPPAQGFS